jgi:glycosyltransferase involved in cell wall biosynthesis
VETGANQMKIAIVSDAVYPYHKGGKERRFFEISTRLARNGHDVHIYCMKWWKGPEKVRVEHGVHLHGFAPYFPLYSGKRRSIREGVMFGISCLKLITESWDVIEVDHMPYFPLFFTKLVCLLKGKKMFATWNEVWGRDYWIEYMGPSGHISAFIEWASVFLPDTFISISQHTTTRLKDVYNIPAKKIKTVSTGLDTTTIDTVIPSKKKYDVIYAGRLWKHKNVYMLVDAMAELVKRKNDITCVIVGNGHEKKHLMRQVKELCLQKHVFFEDFMPHHDDVFALMKSSKVYVLPSTREGFGMAVVEANACGIPAIVIDHYENAATDHIDTDNGVKIPFDKTALANAMYDLLKKNIDPEKVKQVAAKYSWDRIVKRLEEVYRE